MSDQFEYLGKGIYSVSEASQLTDVPTASIRRWLRGHSTAMGESGRSKPAVFRADFEELDDRLALSFLDLIEVQFIHSFRKHGVSWAVIRAAAIKAAELLHFDHPFTKRQFFTDGSSILARVARENRETELLNLVQEQYEIDRLVAPLLYENLDFGDFDVANRWWPSGRAAGIVVDPQRNLGKPTVVGPYIPTATLMEVYKATQSIERVADWYEIEPRAVRQAVEFETARAA